MVRVLHLIDGGEVLRPGGSRAGAALAACRTLMLHAPGFAHRVCLIGGTALARLAREAGLGRCDRVSPPFGRAALAWPAMGRLLADQGRPDVVQCYSEATVNLARRVSDSSGRVLLCLEEPRDGSGWPGTILLTPGTQARDRWIAAGAGPDRVEPCPPPVEPMDAGRRAAVRESLGMGPDDSIIAPVDFGPACNALRCTFLQSLLAVAGISVTLVMPADVPLGGRARRFARIAARTPRVVTTRSAADALLAADIGFWDAGGAGPTSGFAASPGAGVVPIARAHAAGLPVIAPGWAFEEDLSPPDVRAACSALNSTLPELARIMLGFLDEPARRRDLSDRVRAYALGAKWGARAAEAASRVWRAAAGASGSGALLREAATG